MKKEITITRSKWICGKGNSSNLEGKKEVGLGKGSTKMLNKEGFMCCLGQASLQLSTELIEDDLFDLGTPSEVSDSKNVIIPYLSQQAISQKHFVNTDFTLECMCINDATNTTISEKEIALKRQFRKAGINLKFID